MAIIISFSGIVGTGKSICARHVSSRLMKAGKKVYYFRFRKTSLKSFLEPKRQISRDYFIEDWQPNPTYQNIRFKDFKQRNLVRFVLLIPYYLILTYFFYLIINFRFKSDDIVLVDRFIYDNLCKYRLSNRGQQILVCVFFKLIPKPEMAFILSASFERIMQSRPLYDTHYLQTGLTNYHYIKDQVPEAKYILEDNIRKKMDQVYREVIIFLNQRK